MARRAKPDQPARPRSLADDLRARTDEQLVDLILSRPDIVRPTPADLSGLAARSVTTASVQSAIERLDQAQLAVLEAIAAHPEGIEAAALAGYFEGRDVTAVVDGLWRLALVWRGSTGYRTVHAVEDLLGPYPAGLGPAFTGSGQLTNLPSWTSPESLAAELAGLPEDARTVLDQLAWGPPVGTVHGEDAVARTVKWLLAHDLLIAAPGGRVVLPREVAMALRGGRLHREPVLDPPEPATTPVSATVVASVGGGAAQTLLDHVAEIVHRWSSVPPRILRSGGLAIRDLKALARALDVPEDHGRFLVELVACAALVADDGQAEPSWVPTADVDPWALLPPAERYAGLVLAWWSSSRARAAILLAQQPELPVPHALSHEAQWGSVRRLRRDVLAAVAESGPQAAFDVAGVAAVVRWRGPVRSRYYTHGALDAVLEELDWLGLRAIGAATAVGRELLAVSQEAGASGPVGPVGASGPAGAPVDSGADRIAQAAAAALPPVVDHVLLQADLTAVAPGPVHGELASFLRAAADLESRGSAGVYRFGPDSIRRALDEGWTADTVRAALQRWSRTPVPQPLDYLVGDVARRHGATRVGSASCYVRSDDPAALEVLLADRTMARLGLRRIAPTVLVSQADPAALVTALRASGSAPVVELPDGTIATVPGPTRRTSTRRRQTAYPNRLAAAPVTAEAAATLVGALRNAVAASPPRAIGQLPWTDPTTTAMLLRDAAAQGRAVWVGLTDQRGQAARHLFHPTRVNGGLAWGRFDDAVEETVLWLHRVTGVSD